MARSDTQQCCTRLQRNSHMRCSVQLRVKARQVCTSDLALCQKGRRGACSIKADRLLLPGAGKREKITITNDKGRLSQEDIERMVQEAEEFAEQDKAVKAKVDARNALETYCYNMKQTIEDKLGDKLDEDDKEKVQLLLPL